MTILNSLLFEEQEIALVSCVGSNVLKLMCIRIPSPSGDWAWQGTNSITVQSISNIIEDPVVPTCLVNWDVLE